MTIKQAIENRIIFKTSTGKYYVSSNTVDEKDVPIQKEKMIIRRVDKSSLTPKNVIIPMEKRETDINDIVEAVSVSSPELSQLAVSNSDIINHIHATSFNLLDVPSQGASYPTSLKSLFYTDDNGKLVEEEVTALFLVKFSNEQEFTVLSKKTPNLTVTTSAAADFKKRFEVVENGAVSNLTIHNLMDTSSNSVTLGFVVDSPNDMVRFVENDDLVFSTISDTIQLQSETGKVKLSESKTMSIGLSMSPDDVSILEAAGLLNSKSELVIRRVSPTSDSVAICNVNSLLNDVTYPAIVMDTKSGKCQLYMMSGHDKFMFTPFGHEIILYDHTEVNTTIGSSLLMVSLTEVDDDVMVKLHAGSVVATTIKTDLRKDKAIGFAKPFTGKVTDQVVFTLSEPGSDNIFDVDRTLLITDGAESPLVQVKELPSPNVNVNEPVSDTNFLVLFTGCSDTDNIIMSHMANAPKKELTLTRTVSYNNNEATGEPELKISYRISFKDKNGYEVNLNEIHPLPNMQPSVGNLVFKLEMDALTQHVGSTTTTITKESVMGIVNGIMLYTEDDESDILYRGENGTTLSSPVNVSTSAGRGDIKLAYSKEEEK